MKCTQFATGTVVAVWCAASLAAATADVPRADPSLVLQSDRLAVVFDRQTGTLTALQNKLTGETYQVRDDQFAIEAAQFHLGFADARLVSLNVQANTLKAAYRGGELSIEVLYTLRGHFLEKQMTVTARRDYALKKLVVSRPAFSAAGLKIVAYRYPKFGRKPGAEPTCTFFGRTPQGGFFTGVEVPFDASALDGRQVTLSYAPSLQVKAVEKLACEPAYFGVYRRGPGEVETKGLAFRQPAHGLAAPQGQGEQAEELPLPSESEAMLAMTAAILGPPRFGLVPMACGWHSEMVQHAYTEQSVAGDMRSLDFLADCGIDWVSDSHPWGGETEKMNALGADGKYQPGPLVRKFLDHAQQVGVKVVMWSSMNKTHAWSKSGRPFRSDKPEWLIDAGASPPQKAPAWRRQAAGTLSAGGNCLANGPFFDWLLRITLEGMAAGGYKAWAMDGDFFGGGGWYTTVVPVDCQSDQHDHLPGDSNYACQRALTQLTDSIRQRFPETYIFMCRPPMDLGIWSLKGVDACFTLLESGTGDDNLIAGDHLRRWSRVRVQRDFFPHYLDQPLLFPSRAVGRPRPWTSQHIDYIMLSALSSAPNQLYYLPTKSGIPQADKAEIRKWLDWGRKHAEFLKVRKDLPDWPAAGKLDGSAHLLGDRGFVFLFNSNQQALAAQLALGAEGIGLTGKGPFQIAQEYPPLDRTVTAALAETVRWQVPAETSVILRIQPAVTGPGGGQPSRPPQPAAE